MRGPGPHFPEERAAVEEGAQAPPWGGSRAVLALFSSWTGRVPFPSLQRAAKYVK